MSVTAVTREGSGSDFPEAIADALSKVEVLEANHTYSIQTSINKAHDKVKVILIPTEA